SVIGYARDGSEALDIIKDKGADIVITDLKMPIMSGTELIAAATCEFPDIKFIVVSGYDDFNLVREAYSLGAKDYFLKFEMEPDVILGKLLALAEEVISERKQKAEQLEKAEELSRLRRLEKIINSSHYIIREKLLRELIWSQSTPELCVKMESYGISLDENSLRILVLTLDNYFEKEESEWYGEHELFKYAILNVLEEICSSLDGCHVFCNHPNEYVVLSNISDTSSCNLLFNEIQSALWECFALSCHGGASGTENGFTALKELYIDALAACSYDFVIGGHSLIYYNDIKKTNEALNPVNLAARLKSALGSMNATVLRETAEELRIAPSVGVNQIDDVKNLFYLYYSEISSFAETENIKEELSDLLLEYKSTKLQNSLLEMNKWLTRTLSTIATIMTGEHIIIKAKSYIKAHYMEQITLSSVAKMLQISESHLSRLFRKMQGDSFTEYLQRTRMDIATELLRTSNMKIYEIARAVGYTSSEQFSRMFKKVTGRSPKSFTKK
ncbi:MAG: helix-turn-helix domain-containing protein, partial [Clostridia bacterium]|nr:helix-turn-helix domain-containing protein [Clostridia bacterium]